MEKNKLIIAIVLVGIILVFGIIVFVKKDSLFRNEVNITYPDNCMETYVNGELTTPICENGRLLQENNPMLGGEQWIKVNLTN